MSRNTKNVIKWLIAVLALVGMAFGVVELVPDPQNPDKELLLPLGWTITILVLSIGVFFGWYGYRVFFTKN